MVNTYILPVVAGSKSTLFNHWWQWVLISLALTAIFVGALHVLYTGAKVLLRHLFRDKTADTRLPETVFRHIQKYVAPRPHNYDEGKKPKARSLGIYLGPFDQAVLGQLRSTFSGKDTIILNPLENNVATLLSEIINTNQGLQRILGRIDVSHAVMSPLERKKPEQTIIGSVDQLMTIILTRFKDLGRHSNSFNGVLLAGWNSITIEILHTLSYAISSHGLAVYLEASPPAFLQDAGVLKCEAICGLVMRNALIMPNGERRDCFGMDCLRTTLKSFVAQSCLRDFTVLTWETVHEGIVIPDAVLKRTYSWCSFYNVIPWIGTERALFDPSVGPVTFEPLSAFDWLKDFRVMEAHRSWKNRRAVQFSSCGSSSMTRLSELFPALELNSDAFQCEHDTVSDLSGSTSTLAENLEWFILDQEMTVDPFSSSSKGDLSQGLGCFPLGIDMSEEDFDEIVISQRTLKELDLLQKLPPEQLREYGIIFQEFIAATNVEAEAVGLSTLCPLDYLVDFTHSLSTTPEGGEDYISVFLGLQSGLQKAPHKQFWGVYHASGSNTEIYISKDSQDILSTLLHVYLSSKGLTRRQCLGAEISFGKWKRTLVRPHDLPPRLVQDISWLTPDERLLLLQRTSLTSASGQDEILKRIRSAIMESLVDAPTIEQLKIVNTVDYIKGAISADSLVAARILWHCESKRSHPDLAVAMRLFRRIEADVVTALKNRDRDTLNRIIITLKSFSDDNPIDATVDIFALSVFCTMRKLAFEEVFIEVTDRNPLFNDQSDQSAAFAELFALGSRCEAYFDMTPSQFGGLLHNKFRSYYSISEHQPPIIKDTQGALDSAYSEAQMDVDPNEKASRMPTYQRFTFLSVFAIPALIDILMLTTTGHGLYLSANMHGDQHSATIALMISLLLSGAIGTWITCGGTYYLASMAFSAMNYFVVTRLLGGVAFTMFVAVIGFISFVSTSGAHSALIFVLYLIVLTTYLCLLAALANYQFVGSAFQSGRVTIILCIPVLFISPLVSIFVPDHDTMIYLTVLYIFITLLLLGVRRVGARWTTWYQKIALLDDTSLKDWYIDGLSNEEKENLKKMTDPKALILAREALQKAVNVERQKAVFAKKSQDPIVSRMVNSYQSTVFLMDWYCRFTGVAKPIMFSSSWNSTTKVALDSLQKSQLGIRFHNGFIHWRQAGEEIGCTILYFILALLDKWVSLIDGGEVLGLGSSQVSMRKPVGFGLAYYLVGAVLLDFNASKLHELAGSSDEELVSSDAEIPRAAKMKLESRRLLYWKTLSRYLLWHIWGLAVTTVLIWMYATKEVEAIIFMAYVGAYTGLLWFQYTKIFCGPRALKPLLIGVAIGLAIGFTLEHVVPSFIIFSDVVALGTATWTVAILSLFAANIVGKPENYSWAESDGSYDVYSDPGPEQSWSQAELKGLYESLADLKNFEKSSIRPASTFGVHVVENLSSFSSTKLPELAAQAYPNADYLLAYTKQLFESGSVSIHFVAGLELSKYDQAMRAVSFMHGRSVDLIIGCELGSDIHGNGLLSSSSFEIAELLVQVTAERYLGYSPQDAVLLSHLWTNSVASDMNDPDLRDLERQLRLHSKAGTISKLLNVLRKQLLKNFCLGVDPDIRWEKLSSKLRQYLANRSVGICTSIPAELESDFEKQLKLPAGVKLGLHLARCNYAAFISASMLARARSCVAEAEHGSARLERVVTLPVVPVIDLHEHTTAPLAPSLYGQFRAYTSGAYHYLGTICKFLSIAFVADPEYQREVRHMFPASSHPGNFLIRAILISIWMWSKSVQRFLLPTFLFHKRPQMTTLWKRIQGLEVTIKRRRILIRNLDGAYTGFVRGADHAGHFKLFQYKGDHRLEPDTDKELCAINTYSENLVLQKREEICGSKVKNAYVYQYRQPRSEKRKRLSRTDMLSAPITRNCVAGEHISQSVSYNSKGQIDSGSYLKDENLVRFQYHYQRAPRHSGALLRAEFVLPHMSCTVSWCAPPRRNPEKLETWIPHSLVTEATFVVDSDVWESKYIYDHKFHPTIVTTLNGQHVETPPLILHDYLDVLKRPKHVSVLDDNPLFGFNTIKFSAISRFLGLSIRRYPIPTTQARSQLWRAWKEDPTFDGVVVRWLDERLLRRDIVMKPYWRKRDCGNLAAAEKYLDQNRDAVMASVDLDNTISSMTPLAIKINDLYTFGQGGDAVSRTRSNITTQEENDTQLHVIAVDTGTWPNEGGGVSSCRRDVVNNLRTIKWHMVSESANDFGIPKSQIERNVHSLKVIPLWGLDLMTPIHGLFANRLDSQVDHIMTHITRLDIERAFVPILEAMINGARAIEYSDADLKQMTRALINLNSYFRNTKHWSETWGSEVVKSAWRRLWLSQTAPNARPSTEWLRTELPTLGQLDQGLEIWSRYLFIFAIPIPDEMPAVFQASHHSVSASYGVVCKIKRGCTLQIWDHAISWRETNLYLSSALCPLAPFVRNALLGLMKMTSVLTLHHADIILPCADFFNPNWEVEIGTCQGRIQHRAAFKRKIDPVVNGITNIERFTPVKEIKSEIPTVTMLSHIWFAKDIKTALLSADIIINKWGFRDFRLDIYGSIDKVPAYTTQCQEIIATKSLRNQVKLQGEANPSVVLEKTWVFLNSSVSEGLPLALGEAALTGAPVVCTDVGASLRVLTSPADGACYSAVVAPNDALAMARAQIKLLALLEEWAQYEDPIQPTKESSFPDEPTSEDVARITKRMYEQHEARRALGMRTRAIVEKSFSGDRYLREHEQMLWIGKARNDMSLTKLSGRVSPPLHRASMPARATNTPSLCLSPPVPVLKRSSAAESVPSLIMGDTSVTPSLMLDIPPSLMSDMLPDIVVDTASDERVSIQQPQPAAMVVEKGLRRVGRTVEISFVGSDVV